MKTLITILCTLLLAACGGGTPPPACTSAQDCTGSPGQGCSWSCVDQACEANCPNCTVSGDCDNGQLCVNSRCIDPQCWSDNDCPQFNRCIDNVCVEKPECITDNDCNNDQLVCLLYKCKPYLAKDPSAGTGCICSSETCLTCGVLTYCQDSTCTDACLVYNSKKDSAKDAACADTDPQIVNCHQCACWRDGHQITDGATSCKARDPIHCTEKAADEFNNMIETTDWNAVVDEVKTLCRT